MLSKESKQKNAYSSERWTAMIYKVIVDSFVRTYIGKTGTFTMQKMQKSSEVGFLFALISWFGFRWFSAVFIKTLLYKINSFFL